jgi:hypothetical protein
VNVVKRGSLGLLFLGLFVGCGTSRPLMPVSESLEATSSALRVQRRQAALGPLSFGDWRVTDFKNVERPGRTKWGMGIEPISVSKSKGTAAYRFTMTSGAQEQWECDCYFERNRRDLGLGRLGETELTYDESLDCDLQRVGADEMWRLKIDGSLAIGGRGYTGTLVNGSHSLTLQASNRIAGLGRLPGPPLGYLFVREGEEIASAELILPGHVRISDDAGDDRDVIATAAAALLMQPGAH